ncbi:MAG TPA: hypothetical protein VGJ13_10035 [Pseudonocardiaceae bacterium]|jgi:hypothetical protein
MKRLLVLATTALVCAAGGGLASVAVAPVVHRSATVRRLTAVPRSLPSSTASSSTPPPAPPTAPPTTVATPAALPAVDPAVVAARVQQTMLAVLPSADVGFEVYDRQTGTVLASNNADQQFAAMSVVKLLIALGVLAANNWALPDSGTQQQLHQMLADSDDGIADNLWGADGGPALVTRMVTLLGLTGTRPPDDPGEWGDTLITAQDMVTVYRYITDQLPAPTRDFLVGALSDAPQTAADGFDQYFGIPNGLPHTTWAIKQGWGTSGSQAVMASTGLVGGDLRYVVVVLSSASANSYLRVPAVVTAGASALADVLSLASP